MKVHCVRCIQGSRSIAPKNTRLKQRVCSCLPLFLLLLLLLLRIRMRCVCPFHYSLVERLAEGDGAVLRCVVVVYVEVTLARELQVQVAVLGHSVQHVIQESQPGINLIHSYNCSIASHHHQSINRHDRAPVDETATVFL